MAELVTSKELVDRVIAENPYTKYTYPAQNGVVEEGRASRYARMIAREVLRAASAHEPHPANPTEQELHTEIERLQRELRGQRVAAAVDKARAAHEPPAEQMVAQRIWIEGSDDSNPGWYEYDEVFDPVLLHAGWEPLYLRAAQPPGDVPGLLHALEVLRQRWSHNVNFEAAIGACKEEIELRSRPTK